MFWVLDVEFCSFGCNWICEAKEESLGILLDFSGYILFVALSNFGEKNRQVFKVDELGFEIAQIAFPAALALTADPIASLVDTAFIGQIGTDLPRLCFQSFNPLQICTMYHIIRVQFSYL